MSSELASLPGDLLTAIFGFTSAHELGLLLLSGDSVMRNRILTQPIVKGLYYRPKRPEKAFWPNLASRLRGLQTIDISMPKYYEHMPLIMKGDCSLPPSLTEVVLCYAQANDHLAAISTSMPHLRHLYLDGMRAPFSPVVTLGSECESLIMKSFSLILSTFGCLTTIDMPLYLHAPDISRLPPTLTRLSLLTLLGSNEPAEFNYSTRDTSVEKLDELECVVFPPDLRLLHIQWRKVSHALFSKLPPTLTELHMDSLRVEGQLSFPPNLRHLSLYDYFNASYPERSDQLDHLFASLPANIETMELQANRMEILPESVTFPPSLTRFRAHRLQLHASHLKSFSLPMERLSCSLEPNVHELYIPSSFDRVKLRSPVSRPLLLHLDPHSHLQTFSLEEAPLDQSSGNLIWPSTLTSLSIAVLNLEASFFESLPPTLRKLGLSADRVTFVEYGDDNGEDAPPAPRGQHLILDSDLQWPPFLCSLKVTGIRGYKLYHLPSSLLSIQTDHSPVWDTPSVLSRLPDSLTQLSIPGLIIHDEDVPLLPSSIVSIDGVILRLSITGTTLLPPCLRQLGRFERALSLEMAESISEWCTVRAPSLW